MHKSCGVCGAKILLYNPVIHLCAKHPYQQQMQPDVSEKAFVTIWWQESVQMKPLMTF